MSCSVTTSLRSLQPDIVSVNGVEIARDEIAREVQNHPAAAPVEAFKAAGRALVVRELLLQEAHRLALTATPVADELGRCETDGDALIRVLIEREVVTPEPDDATCRRYYENNCTRFCSPAIWEAAHILFGASAHDQEAYLSAQRDAEAAFEMLGHAPERFADLARARSSCSSASQGGNLGQISQGQTTPEFEAALAWLSPGQISTPVDTRYGFHIIRLDRHIDGCTLPYEVVADHIASYLAEHVRRRATAQYIARLVSRNRITGIDLPNAETYRVN